MVLHCRNVALFAAMPTPDATAREPLPRDVAERADHVLPAAPPEFPTPAPEIGGRAGAEPTRYGDWERAGRCIDF
jgi:hypothetical protein